MYLGMTPHPQADGWGSHHDYPTVDAYAHSLFDMFRRADSMQFAHIYCQRVEIVGLGRALMDRLVRAAEASKK